MDAIPTSRLSRSKLSTSSLRVKSVDAGSFELAYRSRGSLHVGESLPTDVRARDGSPPASIAIDPPRRDVPIGTLPPTMERVSGTDANSSPSTMISRDPSAVSPSIRPMPNAVTWATDGAGLAGSSGAATIALGYDPPITIITTFTHVSGVLTGYVAPTTVGTTSAIGSPVCPVVDSGITTITGCSMTPKGVP